MAKSVNKVILVGNVGQDPEVKYTASGVPVAKLSRAADHSPRTTRNFLERRLWTGGPRGLDYTHPDIAANLFHDTSVHIVPVTTAKCLSTLS